METKTVVKILTIIFLFCFFVADMPMNAFNSDSDVMSTAGISCIFKHGNKDRVGASELSLLYLLGTGAGVAGLYYIIQKKRSKK